MLAGLGLSLHAAGPAGYRIGDVADADVTTPVALDVADPVATAALRAARAQDVPVVFRSFPVATNGLTVEFLNVFARAQSNFLAAVAANFHTERVSAEVLASPEFARFFTAFNDQGRFPVTTELAAEWVQGRDGGSARDALLARLQSASRRPVQPDELPAGLVPGATVRLVAVTVANQTLSLAELQRGRLIPGVELITVAQAQQRFCDGFPAAEQRWARAVSALLKPNCFPDAPSTELLSGLAVSHLVATEHFEPGATVLHRGDRVDARTKAVLEVLNEKAVAAAASTTVAPQPPAPVPARAAMAQSPSANPQTPALHVGGHLGWLVLVLAGISAGASLFAWRQVVVARRRDAPASPPSGALTTMAYPPEPVDKLSQVLRDAVVQEMAWQRRELLVAQETAADEIAALVRQLDDLQMPVQERERAYEARIQALENELAQRTKENQELLQLKLDIVRRQLETERAANQL
ncbi:MAG: hypothetical protein P4N60_21345 [Verrucomicrobiae bacterium]|nr:hypothetical protein [Verrucomicrobiae bacterium]